MCTVTIVPTFIPKRKAESTAYGPGFRLACNRDESRRRRRALPPQVRTIGNRRVVLPVDPVAGGTWIAVNDCGLTMTLLNVYAPSEDANSGQSSDGLRPAGTNCRPHHRSRGLIIVSLMSNDSVVSALDDAGKLKPSDFPPFRLVMVDDERLAELRSDGHHCTASSDRRGDEPLLFTSSGLGDHVVEPPRRELFRSMFAEPEGWLRAQDVFHGHQWPERPHVSVCMDRLEARTVSHTAVNVGVGQVRLSYRGEAPNVAVEPFVVGLEQGRGGSAP